MRVVLCMIASLGVLYMGCNRYDSPAEALSGSMTGFVGVLDENGNSLADRSNVKISLENTNYSTNSDANGRWKLDNIPAGIYTITYSRDSLSTNKTVAYQFVGNGTAYLGTIQVPAVPRIATYLDSIAVDSSNQNEPAIIVYGRLTEEAPLALTRSVLLCLGNGANVSSDPATYTVALTTFVSGGSTHFSEAIPFNQLTGFGFTHGSRIYVASYMLSRLYYRYPDIATGKQNYAGISPIRRNYLSVLVP